MKIFLDSTYFFPLIGVTETSIDQQFLPKLVKNNQFQVLYSSITLFEISAKGAKLIQSGEITEPDVVNGLNSLQYWREVFAVDPWSGEIQRLSFFFRRSHPDFIDCLILASAILESEKFVCEDEKIHELVEITWKKIILDCNANFEIYNSSEIKL